MASHLACEKRTSSRQEPEEISQKAFQPVFPRLTAAEAKADLPPEGYGPISFPPTTGLRRPPAKLGRPPRGCSKMAPPLPRTPGVSPQLASTPFRGESTTQKGPKAERGEAEVDWLRRVLNTEDPTAAPEPESKEFNRVREEAARRIADARRRAEERARGTRRSQPTKHGRAGSSQCFRCLRLNDGLWAGVAPDVLGPSRGQTPARPPLHPVKVPAKPIHPASSEASSGAPPTSGESYVPGSLVEHCLTRRSRGSSKPAAPEEETADPDEGLEEIVVDEVPPEFRESPPGVPPVTAAVPAQEEERDENGRYVYHPSFIDPPVDESELDEDGLTSRIEPIWRC